MFISELTESTFKYIVEKRDEINLMVEYSPNVMWVYENSGTLLYANKALFNYLNLSFSGISEGKWVHLVHPKDLQDILRVLNQSSRDLKPYEIEVRIYSHLQGEYRWNIVKAIPLKVGNLQKWVATAIDIHNQILFSEKQAGLLESATSANEAKSKFLAYMCHEIRTPLSALIGFSELMKDSKITKKDYTKYVEIINRNSKSLMQIVNDLLDLSKVEAGKLPIEKTNFSLARLINDVTDLMNFKAMEKNIDLNVKYVGHLPDFLKSDSLRIRQILLNVIGNAIKFTESGFVELSIQFIDGKLLLCIEDTGTGIHPEHIRKLFKPFQQADYSTARQFGGTGLGLVLTRQLAEALGGSFVLQKTVLGKGSIFKVTIPVEVPQQPPVKNRDEVNISSAGLPSCEIGHDKIRVLLVEDSVDTQTLVLLMLDGVGIKPDVVSDGLEGVEVALAKKYDVILMDIQMPKMSGYEATRLLRQNNFKGGIIALTANGMPDEAERCYRVGFSDFLSKPLSREMLIQKVLKYKCKT